MAKLPRKTQKIFAGAASNNGVFGSAADNTKILSNDLATIQSKPAYDAGWLDAVIGDKKFPPLEEFQSLQYMWSTQLAYLFENGIPEYDSGTTYYQKSIVRKTGTYELYGSINDENLGNPLTDDSEWEFLLDLSLQQEIPYGVVTGSANSYSVTTTPVFDSLQDGKPFIVKWNGDENTGAATLNPNSINNLPILSSGSPLTGGELKNGGFYIFIQDDTNTSAHLVNPSLVQASETRIGAMEIATTAEMIEQTDQTRAATPYNINQLFTSSGRQSISGNGYQVFPGGLIFQWGTTGTISGSSPLVVTLPTPFPNAILNASVTDLGPSFQGVGVTNLTNTTITIIVATGGNTSASWFAIGY